MVEKAASQITDQSQASAVTSDLGAFEEINEGRAALVGLQRQHTNDLKAGRVRSFVTDELGTLVLVNNEMPQVGGKDTAVRMPQLGGNDTSVRMPAGEVLSFDVPLTRSAADSLNLRDYGDKNDAYGVVELRSAVKARAGAVESKGANAPHETQRGIVSTHKEKDGSRTYTYKDKTTETISADGKDRDVTYPDRSGYHFYPDGRKLIRHADDTRDAYDADGNIEWRQRKRPNGDYAYTNSRGRLEKYEDKSGDHFVSFNYDSQGKLVNVDGAAPVGHWSREKRADGTTYWQNVDDPKQQFNGEMSVDGDGNIYQIPDDSSANIRVFKRAGVSVETVKRTDPIEHREYDEKTGKLVSWEEQDGKETTRRQFDPNTGKLASSDKTNRDGSSEHSEYAENGNRTQMIRKDAKGNKETVIYDPLTGKEVASDIKFKDGSTMHVVFDADGNMKEVSSKDKDGNVNQWKQGADNQGTTVKDVSRPEPLGGVGAREIKFPNGFKVHVDFAPSSGYVSGIWTSDRDMKDVKDVHISAISRR